MSLRFRPLAVLRLAPPILLPVWLALTCATAPANPNAGKYPPRPRGCKMRVYHGLPDVKEWDDLGIAHVDCYLDVGAVQCLQRLKMEACRLGADILFDVPKKPLRPTDQGMVYTGHLAHTKAADSGAGQERDDEPDAAAEEPAPAGGGPVEPITPIPAPPAETSPAKDGGAR